MNKVWLTAERQFKKEVLSRGFLIASAEFTLVHRFQHWHGLSRHTSRE